jgi:hypothetical protein
MNTKKRIFPLDLRNCIPWSPVGTNAGAGPTFKRLREECAVLGDLELERIERADPQFGKAIENRILWRELLELELQDIDERIERIAETAATRQDDMTR